MTRCAWPAWTGPASGSKAPRRLRSSLLLRRPRRSGSPAGRLLQKPAQTPVLEHLPVGLTDRAITHHVVLVEDRLQRVPAAWTRLAVVTVHRERHRQLVRNRQRQR